MRRPPPDDTSSIRSVVSSEKQKVPVEIPCSLTLCLFRFCTFCWHLFEPNACSMFWPRFGFILCLCAAPRFMQKAAKQVEIEGCIGRNCAHLAAISAPESIRNLAMFSLPSSWWIIFSFPPALSSVGLKFDQSYLIYPLENSKWPPCWYF